MEKIVVYNRTPIILLIKNALARGNIGLVSAFMLVNAFLAYIDGDGSFMIMFYLIMGLFILAIAFNAFRSEFGLYINIWEDVYSELQRMLLCDPASLPKEEAELREKYIQDSKTLPLDQQVTTIAVGTYIEMHQRSEEKFEKENKFLISAGNVALLLIVLSITCSIITHI